jgi:hypothetical protein
MPLGWHFLTGRYSKLNIPVPSCRGIEIEYYQYKARFDIELSPLADLTEPLASTDIPRRSTLTKSTSISF